MFTAGTHWLMVLWTVLFVSLLLLQVTAESLELHYFSNRPGLWPIVVGVLKGLSNDYFKLDLQVCFTAANAW